jgi:hypothetical protein
MKSHLLRALVCLVADGLSVASSFARSLDVSVSHQIAGVKQHFSGASIFRFVLLEQSGPWLAPAGFLQSLKWLTLCVGLTIIKQSKPITIKRRVKNKDHLTISNGLLRLTRTTPSLTAFSFRPSV